MRAGRHHAFDRRAGAARWPFAVREIDASPPLTPDFQFSLDRILRTTRLYLQLECGTDRGFGKGRYSRR
jgi:hypothetical protein